ncbi:MAG TPA: MATE family efflux transporter [Alphaproteobacteria bacterium]|nr:MATE family efflux transporter [Alphaproteobacteria bacterium]
MVDRTIAAIAPAGGWPDELRALLRLATPLAATQLAEVTLHTTDVVMMSRLGPAALAAGALGANVYITAFIFTLGLPTAVAPLVAQALGRRRHYLRDVRRSVRQGLWATAALGVPFMAALWQARAILLMLGQAPATAALAQDYVRMLVWGLVPALWFMVLRSFIAAMGRPRASFAVIVIAVVAHAFGNWVFMFGHLGAPALGVAGAGVSTSLTNLLAFALLAGFVALDRRFRRCHAFGRLWQPDWRRFAEIFRLGLPIGATTTLEMTMFFGAALLMGLIGTDALAAHQIALQVPAITFMIPLGIAQAATVRVGLAAGAGDTAGIRRAGRLALILGGGFMAAMSFVLWSFPRPIIGLFIPSDVPGDAAVAALATRFLAVAALFQIVDGLQSIGQGILRGLKDTRAALLFAACGYWLVGLPVGAFLAFTLRRGGVGLWLGLALGLAVVAVLVVGRFLIRARRRRTAWAIAD